MKVMLLARRKYISAFVSLFRIYKDGIKRDRDKEQNAYVLPRCGYSSYCIAFVFWRCSHVFRGFTCFQETRFVLSWEAALWVLKEKEGGGSYEVVPERLLGFLSTQCVLRITFSQFPNFFFFFVLPAFFDKFFHNLFTKQRFSVCLNNHGFGMTEFSSVLQKFTEKYWTKDYILLRWRFPSLFSKARTVK